MLVGLGLHALVKLRAGTPLSEMLWACHVASAVLAAGFLAGERRAVAVGFLFHLGVGLPAYLLDAVHNLTTTPTSVLVHALPLGLGGPVVRRTGLPWHALPAAWALWIAAQALTWFTDPELNINLVHAPWGPLARLVPGAWEARALNALLALAFLSTAMLGFRRLAPAPELEGSGPSAGAPRAS